MTPATRWLRSLALMRGPMPRSSLVDRAVGLLVLMVGATVALRWVYDLLRPLLWLFAVVCMVVLIWAWLRFDRYR